MKRETQKGEQLKRMTVWSIVFGFVASVVLAGGAEDVHSARERALRYVFENRMALGLTDPTQELREHRVIPAHKSVIFRYNQLHHGIPVYGVQLVVVVKEHGISTNSKGLRRNLKVDTKPTISSDAASVVALRAAKVTNGYRQPHPHLVILPAKKFGTVPIADVLAWSVDVYAESETEGVKDLTVLVDAKTGEFIAMTSHVAQVDYVGGAAWFKGGYKTLRLSTVAVLKKGTANTISRHYMQDPCFGTALPLNGAPYSTDPLYPYVRSCFQGVSGSTGIVVPGNTIADAKGHQTNNGTIMYSEPPSPGFGDGILGSYTSHTAGADVAISLFASLRYLEEVHGRESANGMNGPQIRALIHYPFESPGAEWVKSCNCMHFGTQTVENYEPTSVDIVAHELGHALSDYGPELILIGPGSPPTPVESAKVAESMADIFAMLVSSRVGPTWDPFPYRLGERTFKVNYANGVFKDEPTHAIRFMDDPTQKVGHVACYDSSIVGMSSHAGAGPANHMFYLLANGGTSACDSTSVTGIGIAAAQGIWFNAIYSLLPDTTYADLRQTFTDAAATLFPGPSIEVAAVDAAFDAVDVPQ